jgi:hypothetical protein
MFNRIKTFATDVAAVLIIAREINAEMKYDEQIAASQAKIGPYKPASIPVQIWA